MATVGNVLTAPESGWQRFDSTSELIQYGEGWSLWTGIGAYNGSVMQTTTTDTTSFAFKGTKIRIISIIATNRSNNVSVKIDDNEEIVSFYGSTDTKQVIVYEKINLPNVVHEVVIKNNVNGSYIDIDAIDIDAEGEIRRIYKKAIITNNNSHYSLDNQTLIHLTSLSIRTGTAARSTAMTTMPALR